MQYPIYIGIYITKFHQICLICMLEDNSRHLGKNISRHLLYCDSNILLLRKVYFTSIFINAKYTFSGASYIAL